jgi:hypothetical protein
LTGVIVMATTAMFESTSRRGLERNRVGAGGGVQRVGEGAGRRVVVVATPLLPLATMA